jgi:O-methyltransferase involved in polyketide biosynthesis
MSFFSNNDSDLSITALYTSAVWAWARLPCADLCATTDAKRVFDVTNAALALARSRQGGAPLRYALLHRHAMIDHLARESKLGRIVELAAGLSPRGAAFTADPAVRYTEIDLPAVVAKKRELLSRTADGRAVLARPNFEVVAGDVETVELDVAEPVFVIAEGLAMYLDACARGRLFAKLRRLADVAGDVRFAFDLVPTSEEPPPGRAGRILEAAMKRFTGGRTFERDARTRSDVIAELTAAGFSEIEPISSADVATSWHLPEAARDTLMVVFTARATSRATRS